ncbi:hypothetical protein [Streptomyces sp. NPDC058872]|uniref:hypothetical protein n=1 Tax=Streptomyces sp. NPDC058872 TaxID=3346661 RepID=UPI003686CF8B
MTANVEGYWCEFVARSSVDGREWFLGGYRANSPRLAIRWLRGRAHRLANALDPIPGVGPLPPECLHLASAESPNPGNIFRKWAMDMHHQGKQMNALANGRSISINAGGPDRIFGLAHTDLFLSLTCRPMMLDFVTEWRLSEADYAAA